MVNRPIHSAKATGPVETTRGRADSSDAVAGFGKGIKQVKSKERSLIFYW